MKRISMILLVVFLVAGMLTHASPKRKPPIIDMHPHAFPADWWGEAGAPNPATGKPSRATTDEALMQATLAAMKRHNIVKAIASGPLEMVAKWKAADPDRLIGSPLFPHLVPSPNLYVLRAAYESGDLGAMGEITAQYAGLSPGDPSLEPYFALAEELDIPVAIHTGLGPPESPYKCCPNFRVRLGNPVLLEEVLVRHPKLRVYIMHGGGSFLQETIAILHMYPQVYADLAVINWVWPRQQFHEHLRRLVEAGFDDRLMFGSDQMVWPEAIKMAIEGIESADFLTKEQKRDIFYNNAARFLRLEQGDDVR